MTHVKRRYDGTARRARAEQLGHLLIDTAWEQFLTDGYAATTITTVAQACGVSVESVYRRFPGKAALFRAVVEQALRGEGPVPAEARSDELPAADLDTLLRGWGRLSAEVAPRVAPLLLLVQAAAAHDPELTDLARELDHSRRLRMTDNARRLALAGHLPPSCPCHRPPTCCGRTAPRRSTTSSFNDAAGASSATNSSSSPASPVTSGRVTAGPGTRPRGRGLPIERTTAAQRAVSSLATSSAICAVLSAAPLRRLSPQTNSSRVLGKSRA